MIFFNPFRKRPEEEKREITARRSWDFQINRSYYTLRVWRALALVSITMTVIVISFTLKHFTAPKYLPYVVKIDQENGIEFAGVVKSASITIDDNMMRSYIISLVNKIRRVSTDPLVLRENLMDAYFLLTPQCQSQLTQYIQDENPFEMSGKGIRREVKFTQFGKIAEGSWRAEWTEYTRQDGELQDKTTKAGTFSYVRFFADDEIAAEKNPLGIYFDEFFISDTR